MAYAVGVEGGSLEHNALAQWISASLPSLSQFPQWTVGFEYSHLDTRTLFHFVAIKWCFVCRGNTPFSSYSFMSASLPPRPLWLLQQSVFLYIETN